MYKTTFQISKMDCAIEEQLVRMKLDQLKNIKALPLIGRAQAPGIPLRR
jgi:hypothetical protein